MKIILTFIILIMISINIIFANDTAIITEDKTSEVSQEGVANQRENAFDSQLNLQVRSYQTKIDYIEKNLGILTLLFFAMQIFVVIAFAIIGYHGYRQIEDSKREIRVVSDNMINLKDVYQEGVKRVDERQQKEYERVYTRLTHDKEHFTNQFSSMNTEIHKYMSFLVMYLTGTLKGLEESSIESVQKMVNLHFGTSDLVGDSLLFFKDKGTAHHIPFIEKSIERNSFWEPFIKSTIEEIKKRENKTTKV